ncbi:YadA-like family protein [Ursidibacter arcticus]
MNKIFRVIWNHSTQSWTAVSELSTAKGKTKSSSLSKAAAAVALAFAGADALAAAVIHQGENIKFETFGTNAGETSQDITQATEAGGVKHGTDSVLLGNNIKLRRTIDQGNARAITNFIAMGNNITLTANDQNPGQRAIAIGNNITLQSSDVIAIGNGASPAAIPNAGYIAIGREARNTGNAAQQLTRKNPYNPLFSSGFFHEGLNATTDGLTNFGVQGEASYNAPAVTIGDKALSQRGGTTVVGGGAFGAGLATSIGSLAYSEGTSAVALGSAAYAGGNTAIAIGRQAATARGRDYAIAIGGTAAAAGFASTAIGHSSTAKGFGSVSIGGTNYLTAKASQGSQAAGPQIGADYNTDSTTAGGFESVALGAAARAEGHISAAVGPYSKSSGDYSLAQGFKAQSEGLRSTAQGQLALAKADNSLATGVKTRSLGNGSTAIGSVALALSDNSVAIGHNVLAGNGDVASFADLDAKVTALNESETKLTAAQKEYAAALETQQELNLEKVNKRYAYGANSEQYKTADTLHVAAQARTKTAQAALTNALTDYNEKKAAYDSVLNEKTDRKDAIAIGSNSIARGEKSIAFGFGNVVSGDKSGAFGDPSFISGTGTYTLGNDNGTEQAPIAANNAGAFGNGNKMNAAGAESRIVGNNNTVNVANTFVVGNKVNATQANSVVLGNESTDRAATAETTANVRGFTYSGFAGVGNAVNGVVSVGQAGKERQIINVAAGKVSSDSTDAINGSQLYLVADRVEQGFNVSSRGSANTVANIKPTENIDFSNGTLTVATASADGDGAKVVYDVVTQKLSTQYTDGKAKVSPDAATVAGDNLAAPNPNALTTAQNVADAINASGWKAGENAGNVVEAINPGDQVNFINGTGTTSSVAKTAEGGVNVTYNVDFGTLTTPETSGVAIGGSPNKVASTDEVMKAVNNAAFFVNSGTVGTGTNTSGTPAKTAVKAGDEVKFIAGDNVNIAQDGKNFTISVKVPDAATPVETTSLTVNEAPANEVGKVQAPDTANGSKLVNATTVADAINNSGFTLKTSATTEGTKETSTPDEVINPGDTVEMVAGKNLKIKQEANGKVTYATEDDVQFNSVQLGGNTGPKLTNEGNNIKVSQADGTTPTTITNVEGNLNGAKTGTTAPTTKGEAPTNLVNSNVATVGDVLNAGWNLKAKDADVDFVTAYDTVQFLDGNGTSVVAQSADQKTSTIKFDVKVDGTTIKVDNNGNLTAEAPQTTNLNVNPETATNNPGKVETPTTDGDKLVNATTIANAINNSGWTLGNTTAKVGFINPGDRVNFVDSDSVTSTVTDKGNGVFDVTFNAKTAAPTINTNTGKAEAPAAGTNLVNASTLVDTVNNVSWTLQENDTEKDKVTAGNVVNFVNGDTTTVNITTAGDVSKVKVEVNATKVIADNKGSITNNTNGTAKTDNTADAPKIATTNDVVNAINNSGWIATSDKADGGEVSGTTEELVNPGEKVTLKAGKNLKLEQAGANFTFSTKNDVEFNSITVPTNPANPTENPVTINAGGISAGNKPITNVANGTNPTDAVNLSQLNATKANVVAGTNIKDVTVSDNPEGGKTYTVNANGTKVVAAADSLVTVTPSEQDDKNVTTYTVDLKPTAVVDAVKGDITVEGNKAATTTNDDSKLATTGDVVNAINNSGFTLKTSAVDSGKKLAGADEVINPGDEVELVAGKNLTVKQENGKVTYATGENVSFTSVQLGAPNDAGTVTGPKLTADGDNIKVFKADGTAPTTITNVEGNLNGAKTGTTAPTTKGEAPADVNNSNVATVGDVLNAGFNLQNNGDDKDFVKAFDTLNVKDGGNTKAVIDVTNEGKLSNISVNVVGLPVQYTDANGKPVAKVGDKYYTVDENGNPTTAEVPADQLVANVINPAAKPNEKGDATTLGNVVSGLKPYTADDAPDTKKAAAGLVNLTNNNVPDTNVATVGDIRNMGWIVSAGDDYSEAVKNANEVKFVGDKGVSVTGETKDNIREIKIAFNAAADAGSITNNDDGTVKTDDKAEAPKVATTNDVVDAINSSGFKATIARNDEAFEDQAGKNDNYLVKPGTTVKLQAGKNLKVKQNEGEFTFATKDELEADKLTLTGKPGTNGNNGADGQPAPAQPAPKADITVVNGPAGIDGKGSDGKDGTSKTRIEYQPVDTNGTPIGEPEQVATLNDGLKFQGNNADEKAIEKKLNDTLEIVGGSTDAENVTAKNTYVENKDGKLTVKFADRPTFNEVKLENNGNNVSLAADAAKPNNLVLGGNKDENGNAAPVTVSNVASNLPETVNKGDTKADGSKADAPTTAQKTPDNVDDIKNNAATVSDVLNAGFNLQNNKEAKDFVKPYDTLNFVDGGNTQAVVDTDADGKVSNISVNVVGLPVQYTDAAGKPVAKVGDKYFTVGPDGKPTTNPVAPENLTTNLINPAAAPNEKGEPVTLGNVASNVPLFDETTPAVEGLLNLGDVYDSQGNPNPIANNAATVGDLAHLGWIVTATGNDFGSQVRNADQVNFVGTGLANVTGAVTEGVATITVDVNAQNVVEAAQQPVVYSNANGDKLFKQADGTFNTKADGTGTQVQPKDVIASMNNGSNQTAPTKLTNIGSSISSPENQAKPYLDNLKAAAENATTVNNAVNVGDLNNAIQNTGFNLATKVVDGTNGKADATTAQDKRIAANDTFNLNAGNNIEVKQIDNGYEVALSKDVNLTNEGSLTVGPVTINKDGINAGDKKVTNVADGDISPNSKDAINGSQLYAVKEVAEAGWNLSVNNGQNAGKVAPKATVDLNNKDGNINITKDGNNVTFDLAPVVKIGGDNNKVTIDGDKGTIGGLTNKTFDPNNFTSGQAATEDQLGNVYNTLNNSINETGFNLTGKANGGEFEDKSTDKRIGKDDSFTLNAGNNIKVTQIDNGYEVSLKDKIEVTDVQVGEKDADGKPGKDGTVGVNGKDGSSVVLNGKDGSIGLTGPKGADGKTPSANIKVVDGPAGVDGQPGETKTRIEYVPVNPDGTTGTPEKVATLNDGLKFVGNDGKVVTKKLNETLDIIGGADKATTPVSDKNTYVENKDGKLVVQFAETPEFKGVSLKNGDNVVNMTTSAPNTLKLGDNNAPVTVNNVAGNLQGAKTGTTEPTTSATYPEANANDIKNNAATVGDVLNAGWNLQGNGEAKDFVKPYDTVNFANGTGTVANVTSDGKVSTVKFDVKAVNGNGTTATVTNDGVKVDVKADNTGKGTNVTVGPNGVKVDVKVDGDSIKVDDNGNLVAAAPKTTTLTPNTDGTVSAPADAAEAAKVVNATTVANAINKSGFTLTTSENGGKKDPASTGAEVINPGKKVDMAAGKNLTVKQEANGKVTYATADDVSFKTVEATDSIGIKDGPSMSTTGINAGNKVISNVAPGVKDTDAVNVSQLKGTVNNVANQLNNKINRQGKDLRAGIAGANAAAGLPQVYIPGKSMVAASAGTFKGQSAVAVGYSRASDNGKLILKLQGNANTRGDVGGSVGVGYQW